MGTIPYRMMFLPFGIIDIPCGINMLSKISFKKTDAGNAEAFTVAVNRTTIL
jgi:hypothetical protein